MYCKPMVKRKKTEETKTVLQNWIHRSYITTYMYFVHLLKKTHVVFTAALPKSTRKIHCTIILSLMYCRDRHTISSRSGLALSESLRTDFGTLD